uniref:Putative secreted protein n=1 Tax=Panstrongylus lignarius TaxID=156445 RepID=A0A224Y532_9HEMI
MVRLNLWIRPSLLLLFFGVWIGLGLSLSSLTNKLLLINLVRHFMVSLPAVAVTKKFCNREVTMKELVF